MSSFPDRLKELRKSKGITQKAVADNVGLSETSYQYYEYATREPIMSNIIKLADFFEVSADYLLGRSDNPNRQ